MDGMNRTTLFGWTSQAQAEREAHRLCVVGVPADQGNGVSRGARLGPAAIREAARQLSLPRHAGVDAGDLPGCGQMNLEDVLERLGTRTGQLVERDMRPLLLGGDHSITYAPVEALQRRHEIGLVWFDAHTDFSPWSGGRSHDHKQVLRRIEALAGVKRIIQIGYRGYTIGDERYLGPKASVVTAAKARELGEAGLLELITPELPWYVSIDIDVLDPFHAPGTSSPVPEGLEPDLLRDMLATIVRHRTVLGADVMEVNPRLDVSDITSVVAARLLWTIADNFPM